MDYCPHQYVLLNGSEVPSAQHQVWVDKAFDVCIFDTSTALLILAIMGVCGFIESKTYYRHATEVDRVMIGRPPLLYLIQVTLSIMLCLMHPLRFVIQCANKAFFAFVLVHDTIGTLVWGTSAAIIYMERNYDLPTLPRGRHSIYLIVFWSLALAIDTLYLVNVAGTRWYFAMRSPTDVVLVVLFIAQWLFELATLVLGTRAPGILSNSQRSQFIYHKILGGAPGVNQEFGYGSISSCGGNGSAIHDLSVVSSFGQSIDALRCQMESGDLQEQYVRMPRHSPNYNPTVAKARHNERLNRYFNVLPYDETRVVLRGREGEDYINASWITMSIPDLDMTNIYIAAQGPKQSTVNSMWRMIWQERVPLIIMLTDLQEEGQTKCVQYWPELNETIALEGGMIVSCNHVTVNRHKTYTIRDLFLFDEQTGESLTVVHCQMHGWSDHGTPRTTKRLLDFHRAVKSRQPPRREIAETRESLSPPILVHCSAGVGRTGTYILMETLMAQIDAETPLRPLDVLHKMRQQRMAMVQTEGQLLSACDAALTYLEHPSKANGAYR